MPFVGLLTPHLTMEILVWLLWIDVQCLDLKLLAMIGTPRNNGIGRNYLQWWRNLGDFIEDSPMSHSNLLDLSHAIIAFSQTFFINIGVLQVNVYFGGNSYFPLVLFKTKVITRRATG